MLPIHDEFASMIYKKTGLSIAGGTFWYDHSIIKGFDENGKIHKFYRLNVDDNLNMSYSIPKNYSSVDKNKIINWSELCSMNQSRIQALAEESKKLIQDKLAKYNAYTPIITISTGKDSMVVLDLVRSILPSCPAIFNNTSLDCSDTYKMVKNVPNCQTLSPDFGFYQYVCEHHMIPTRFSRFCCRMFKSGIMTKHLDSKSNYIIFMGMRNSESATRSLYEDEWINETEWGNTNWQGILPIRTWPELDVWLYTLIHNLQINPKYKKGYTRVGCAIACPFYNKSTWVLDEYWYPSMRKRWLDILSEDFKEQGKWCIMNCTLDEYLLSWNGGIVRSDPTPETINEFMKYKGITDINLARKFFNKSCNICGCKLKRDDIGLNLKFWGEDSDTFLCRKCISHELNMSQSHIQNIIKGYKLRECCMF